MDDCIETTAKYHVRGGYGQVWWKGKKWLTHRKAWTEAKGPIPDGMQVLHRCDNGPCINVEHLFVGTHADNMADMKAKGRGRGGSLTGDDNPAHKHPERMRRGSDHYMAKLAEDDIRFIRSRAAAGESFASIARDYDVKSDNVGVIARGGTWAHVPGPISRGHVGARPGEANPAARLTADMVVAIRERVAGGQLQKDVATAYGVSKSLVGAIVARQVWKHVR